MTDDGKPVLNQLNLVVSDMDAAIDFYRRLGLDVPDGGSHDGIRHVEIEMAGVPPRSRQRDACAGVQRGVAPAGGWQACADRLLAADARAVDDKYAELTAHGYRGVQIPFDVFWGARYAIVADPDGNEIGLMSPVTPTTDRSAVAVPGLTDAAHDTREAERSPRLRQEQRRVAGLRGLGAGPRCIDLGPAVPVVPTARQRVGVRRRRCRSSPSGDATSWRCEGEEVTAGHPDGA